jgi:hypothetical protein
MFAALNRLKIPFSLPLGSVAQVRTRGEELSRRHEWLKVTASEPVAHRWPRRTIDANEVKPR